MRNLGVLSKRTGSSTSRSANAAGDVFVLVLHGRAPRPRNDAPARPLRRANSSATSSGSRPQPHMRAQTQPRTRTHQDRSPTGETDARNVFALGRVAVTAGDRDARCRAIQRLAETRLRSAGVFIRQCLFDTDPVVSVQAARSFPLVPGNRMEAVLIELFDQLAAPQCEAILDTVGRHSLSMKRFLAYAAADARPSIRRRAMEVLRET